MAACQRQPLPIATPQALSEPIATKESTAAPTAVTTPGASLTLVEPTITASPPPTATPEATATAAGTPTASPTPTADPLPLAEELTFDLVSHEGASVRSVAVDGSVAYVGVGPRLVALDVSNPASPQLIGRSEVLPGLVDAVVLADDGQHTRAYAAAGNQVVALALDSDGQMTVEGAVAMPGYTRALALGEGTLYVGGIVPRVKADAEDTGFIAKIAVQQPEATGLLDASSLLDVANLAEPVRAVALAEDVLYVGHWRDLSAALVENDQLGELRRLGGAADVYGLQVGGGTLLVGDYMKLLALDISARTEGGLPLAEHLWRLEATPELALGLVEGIAVGGDTVYTVGNMPAGNYIPSRLAVPAPEPIDGEAAPAASVSSPLVALNGNHLFVAESDLLEIYDVSRPGELVQVGGYGAAVPPAGDLAIEQTPSGEAILYLYDGSPVDMAWERLFSYRLPTLEPSGQLTIEGAERDRAHSVRARFDLALDATTQHAYLATADGVYQLDIDNPAAPRIAAYESYPEDELTPLGLVVQGNRVYLATESAESLVTSLTAADGALARAGQLNGLRVDAVWAVAGADNKLYLTTSEYGSPERDLLHVVDASGDGLSLLASLELPGLPGWGTLAADGSVVATTVEGQLLVIDVSTAEEPVLAAVVAAPVPSSQVYAIAFHEERLLIVVTDQLLVVDVTDPAHPRVVGAAELPSASSYPHAHLAVSDNLVAVAIREMGVFVFEVG